MDIIEARGKRSPFQSDVYAGVEGCLMLQGRINMYSPASFASWLVHPTTTRLASRFANQVRKSPISIVLSRPQKRHWPHSDQHRKLQVIIIGRCVQLTATTLPPLT